MSELTTTVQMDKQGRLYIPKAVRDTLDITERSATLELQVKLVETHADD